MNARSRRTDTAKTATLRNVRTPEEFAALIRARDKDNLEAIFNTANMVETAHCELGPTEWRKLIVEELKWSKSKGHALLRIAQCEHFSHEAVQHVGLPADWGLLNLLTTLTPEQFARGVDTGVIRAGMARKDIALLKPQKPTKDAPEKPAAEREPQSGADWRRYLWSGLSRAAASLDAPQRAELFTVIRQHIDNLERKLKEEAS